MGILRDTDKVFTPEEQDTKVQICLGIVDAFRRIVQSYETTMAWVNDNPYGLTPEQVFYAMDTDGAELLEIAGAFKTAINTALPGTINDTPPYTITVNADGTVTATPIPPNGQ